MVKKIAILVMVMSVSSPLICMGSLARLAASAAKATRLASRCKELAAKRTLIYSVREWEDTGRRDECWDKIDVESRMSPWKSGSALFAKYKVLSRQLWPQIPDAKKLDKFGEGLVYVARLHYPGAWYSQIYYPRYLFFENNDDLVDIIRGAERGREILCGGEIAIYSNSALTYLRHKEYERDEKGGWIETGRHTVQNETLKVKNKDPKEIEFYATPIQNPNDVAKR